MKIVQQTETDVTILRPEGRIDASALPEFVGMINRSIQNGSRKILIDFSKTEYMSSAGIRGLLQGAKQMSEVQGQFVLCSSNENLMELFDTVRLGNSITIYTSEFEAMDRLLS